MSSRLAPLARAARHVCACAPGLRGGQWRRTGVARRSLPGCFCVRETSLRAHSAAGAAAGPRGSRVVWRREEGGLWCVVRWEQSPSRPGDRLRGRPGPGGAGGGGASGRGFWPHKLLEAEGGVGAEPVQEEGLLRGEGDGQVSGS